jgi:hypothetical protein
MFGLRWSPPAAIAYIPRRVDKPIGVAEYQLVRSLPEPLDTNLSASSNSKPSWE